jgi:hypothetical protein
MAVIGHMYLKIGNGNLRLSADPAPSVSTWINMKHMSKSKHLWQCIRNEIQIKLKTKTELFLPSILCIGFFFSLLKQLEPFDCNSIVQMYICSWNSKMKLKETDQQKTSFFLQLKNYSQLICIQYVSTGPHTYSNPPPTIVRQSSNFCFVFEWFLFYYFTCGLVMCYN